MPPEVAAVAEPGPPYRAVAVPDGGAVRGVITLDGEVPRDSAVPPAVDEAACGAVLADEAISAARGRVAGAVVWLAGLRAGKPLPLERRYELTNDHCRLLPRVQAAVTAGTVNLRSADRLVVHDTRFVRQARGLPVLAVSQTNDAGQVVPVESLLRAPGLVEARCDQHPWTRAYLFAFDHPYFAVTAANGSYSIDGVPPGRYKLVVWQERLGVVTRDVTVGVGQAVALDVALGAR